MTKGIESKFAERRFKNLNLFCLAKLTQTGYMTVIHKYLKGSIRRENNYLK